MLTSRKRHAYGESGRGCYRMRHNALPSFRYLYKFHIEGMLRTPLATNALEECKKMKSVVKLAAEVIFLPQIIRTMLTMLPQLLGEDIVDVVP